MNQYYELPNYTFRFSDISSIRRERESYESDKPVIRVVNGGVVTDLRFDDAAVRDNAYNAFNTAYKAWLNANT